MEVGDGGVYGSGSDHQMAAFIQNSASVNKLSVGTSSDVYDPFWVPSSSSSFHAGNSEAIINTTQGPPSAMAANPIFGPISTIKEEKRALEIDELDHSFYQPEKKRRLSVDQVQYLEKNFKLENKLEPERKVQLAKELGLKPRQVAIWFQNRRARYKTKQLEKDYDVLKASYDRLSSDYDELMKEKEKLQNEATQLKNKLKLKPADHEQDKERILKAKSGPTSPAMIRIDNHPSSDTNDDSAAVNYDEPKLISAHEDFSNVAMLVSSACKQEDATSAKSDIFDSESPKTDGGNNHSASNLLQEPSNSSSQIFDQTEQQYSSDFSQDEDQNHHHHHHHQFHKGSTLLPPLPPCSFPPKIEDDQTSCYDHDFHLQGAAAAIESHHINGCNFALPAVDDQPSFWSWLYLFN